MGGGGEGGGGKCLTKVDDTTPSTYENVCVKGQ